MQINTDSRKHDFEEMFQRTNIKSGRSVELLNTLGGVEGIAKELNVNLAEGIDSNNVDYINERKGKFGSNESISTLHSFWYFFFHSFSDFCVKILIFAVVTLVFAAILENDFKERIMEILTITIAIAIVVISGSFSELSSEKQFAQMLSQMSKTKIRVIRDFGISKKIKEEKLLVGDLVLLDPETIIPCDCVLFEGLQIQVEESDSEHNNNYQSVSFNVKTPYKNNTACDPFLLAGSIIKEGSGVAIVLAVGESTNIKLYQKTHSENQVEVQSLLTQNSYGILKFLFISGIIMGCLNFSYQFGHKITHVIEKSLDLAYLEHYGIEYMIQSLILIIIFIPDGLPILLILVPSFATKCLRKKDIAVRKFNVIGNAGGVSYICFDKSGTLTHGVLQISNVFFSGRNIDGQELKKNLPYLITSKLSEVMFASLTETDKSRVEECINSFQKNLINTPPITIIQQLHLSNLKNISGSKYQDSNGNYHVAIKGNPATVFDMASKYLDETDGEVVFDSYTRKLFEESAKQFIQQGFHVIAIAYKSSSKGASLEKEIEGRKFTIACLLFLKDLTLPESAHLLEMLKKSFIKPIIFTSDTLSSNILFANEIGIVTTNILNTHQIPPILDIEELITRVGIDEQNNPKNLHTFARIMKHVEIISRASSEHKKFIINGLKKCNEIVAMVGEGANDQRAFRVADISITFNKASQTAKSSASVVIFSDKLMDVFEIFNFGRNTYEAVQRFFYFEYVFIFLMIVLTLFGSFVFNAPIFSSVQTIWLTIIDIFVAIVLAFEIPTENTMKIQPFKRSHNLANSNFWFLCFTQIFFQLASILSVLFLHLDTKALEDCNENNQADISKVTIYCTVLFHITTCLQIVNLLNCRRIQPEELNVLSGIKNNPLYLIMFLLLGITQLAIVNYGHGMFKTIPLLPEIHILCIFVGAGSFIIFTLTKLLLRAQKMKEQQRCSNTKASIITENDDESNTLLSCTT